MAKFKHIIFPNYLARFEQEYGQVWVDPPTSIGGWTDEGNGEYSLDGSQGAATNMSVQGVVGGGNYLVEYEIIARTAGDVKAVIGGTDGATNSLVNTYSEEVVATADGAAIIQGSALFNGRIGSISIRRIAS